MAGVFISYRREDAPGHAGRLFDRVRARFGADVVFMDVTAIDAGADFVDAIERAVGTCDVLLAIIGPQWAGAADDAGRRRLENPNDFIRLEITGALRRQVRVVPVLVEGARLPGAADLPDDLQPLLRRNAAELRDARWDADITELISSLERIVKPREEPLRLDAPARGRGRWVAALAVLAVSVGAAVALGPRACASAPASTTSATTAAVVPPAATTPTTPDVVGRSLPEAREILQRAGVDIARVLYRDDRTKAVNLVVVQSEMRTSAGKPPAVALTAVARAAVVVHHRPEDADLARKLLGALTASGTTAGLAIRTLEMPAVRPEVMARVTYSDGALAATAANIAKDANGWLAQSDPGRPLLTASVSAPVVSRTIVIGLPDRGTASTSLGALPDVRGLNLEEARRKLSIVGVDNVDYKWSDDESTTPLKIFDQAEVAGRTSGRTVMLQIGAKGTLWVYHTAKDAPVADPLISALQAHMKMYAIIVRPARRPSVQPNMMGKVITSGAPLAREAGTIATFASDWLTKELGRPVIVEADSRPTRPRELMFWLPSLR